MYPNLQLALNGQYFDAIKSGEKVEEYRLYNDYWKKRIIDRDYDALILTRGYPSKDDDSKRITLVWHGYEIKEITHPHFGDEPVEVFAIKADYKWRVLPINSGDMFG